MCAGVGADSCPLLNLYRRCSRMVQVKLNQCQKAGPPPTAEELAIWRANKRTIMTEEVGDLERSCSKHRSASTKRNWNSKTWKGSWKRHLGRRPLHRSHQHENKDDHSHR